MKDIKACLVPNRGFAPEFNSCILNSRLWCPTDYHYYGPVAPNRQIGYLRIMLGKMPKSRRRQFQTHFFTLMGHEVALNLRSIAENQDMASDLAIMLKAVWITDLGY